MQVKRVCVVGWERGWGTSASSAKGVERDGEGIGECDSVSIWRQLLEEACSGEYAVC